MTYHSQIAFVERLFASFHHQWQVAIHPGLFTERKSCLFNCPKLLLRPIWLELEFEDLNDSHYSIKLANLIQTVLSQNFSPI